MKALIPSALIAALAFPAAAQQELFMAPAALYAKGEDGNPPVYNNVVWLMAATDKAFRYRLDRQQQDFKDQQLADVLLLHFYRTPEFNDALNLFEGRKYAEARNAFATIRQQHEKLAALKDNPGVLAGFYEMECMRKLGDLDALSKALNAFDKDKLGDELKQRQLELYVMWDAVRTKAWDRVESFAKERADRKLAPDHRAQVAYCHGMALEGLGRPQEALLAYQIAMTADAGASDVVARDSALRVLEILDADPEVKESIAKYRTSGGKELNRAWTKVLEGAGVASLFKMTLGSGMPLPDKFKYFLEFKTEPQPLEVPAEETAAVKEAPAADAKPEDKKPAAKPNKK